MTSFFHMKQGKEEPPSRVTLPLPRGQAGGRAVCPVGRAVGGSGGSGQPRRAVGRSGATRCPQLANLWIRVRRAA